jgi:hypothetical protein
MEIVEGAAPYRDLLPIKVSNIPRSPLAAFLCHGRATTLLTPACVRVQRLMTTAIAGAPALKVWEPGL